MVLRQRQEKKIFDKAKVTHIQQTDDSIEAQRFKEIREVQLRKFLEHKTHAKNQKQEVVKKKEVLKQLKKEESIGKLVLMQDLLQKERVKNYSVNERLQKVQLANDLKEYSNITSLMKEKDFIENKIMEKRSGVLIPMQELDHPKAYRPLKYQQSKKQITLSEHKGL